MKFNWKILVFLAVAPIVLSVSRVSGVFENLENVFKDKLYTLDEVSEDIVIVGIDDDSTRTFPIGLGKFNDWQRDTYIPVLENLKEAKAIGVDIFFEGRSNSFDLGVVKNLLNNYSKAEDVSEKEEIIDSFQERYFSSEENYYDSALIKTLKEFENLILISKYNQVEGESVEKRPLEFSNETFRTGFVNLLKDEDGIARKTLNFVNLSNNETYWSFETALASVYLDVEEKNLNIKRDKDDRMYVNFFGSAGSYKTYSFLDLYDGTISPSEFKDKIVLIGITSFKTVPDTVLTPKSNETPMPGIEFRANALQTILDGKFLLPQKTFNSIFSIFVLSFIFGFAFSYLSTSLSTLLLFVGIIFYWIYANFRFQNGLIVDVLHPILAIFFSYVAAWVYRYFVSNKDRRELKSAFSHYVSKELVNEIMKNPEQVKLGGEKKVISVFFSDIEGSTTYSEKVDIKDWVSQINEYFSLMEAILQKRGGTLDKYEGDAIMAFWNAPISQKDHVLRSHLCAIEMQEALLTILHPKWQKEGKPLINFRIGINTGEALVGNFGSGNRFDYTVMGDTVNTSSRLESSANKSFGTRIIVAGFEQYIDDPYSSQIAFRELDTVILPGKNEAVRIYELLGKKSTLSESNAQKINWYQSGLNFYRQRNFLEALKCFEALEKVNDFPSSIMAKRCRDFMSSKQVDGVLDIDEVLVYRIFNK